MHRSALFEDVTAGVEALKGLENLTRLSLNGWSTLRDEDVVRVGELESLQELDLTFCSELTDVGMVWDGGDFCFWRRDCASSHANVLGALG